MAAIKPFRHLVVYPPLIREMGRNWQAKTRSAAGQDVADVRLPPGQHAIDGFPRFGTHPHRPAPPVPTDPVIEISGDVARSLTVPLAELAKLPRRELTADFHCVAGWSATNLRWEGVAFKTFYRTIIEPLQPDAAVTHI